MLPPPRGLVGLRQVDGMAPLFVGCDKQNAEVTPSCAGQMPQMWVDLCGSFVHLVACQSPCLS